MIALPIVTTGKTAGCMAGTLAAASPVAAFDFAALLAAEPGSPSTPEGPAAAPGERTESPDTEETIAKSSPDPLIALVPLPVETRPTPYASGLTPQAAEPLHPLENAKAATPAPADSPKRASNEVPQVRQPDAPALQIAPDHTTSPQPAPSTNGEPAPADAKPGQATFPSQAGAMGGVEQSRQPPRKGLAETKPDTLAVPKPGADTRLKPESSTAATQAAPAATGSDAVTARDGSTRPLDPVRVDALQSPDDTAAQTDPLQPSVAESPRSPVSQQDMQRIAAPPATPDRPAVTEAIAQAARALADGPVELTLNPEELGRVRLTLHGSDAGMIVQLAVERPETLDLLRRNIDLLAQDLRQAGYERLSFSFAGQGQDGDQPHPASADKTPDHPHPTSDPAATAQPYRMHLSQTALDLRI